MVSMGLGRRSPLIAVGVLLVAACVAWSSSANGAVTKKSTLSGSFTFSAPSPFQTGFSAIIGRFKGQYPNVEVKQQFVPIAAYNGLITSQIRAGNAPDVMYTSAGSATPTTVRVLAAANALADLSDQPASKTIPDSMKAAVTYKKKIYAAPLAAWTGFYVYNVDRFKALGLKVPTTLSQLYALCQKIAPTGSIPITISAVSGDLASWAIWQASSDAASQPWIAKRNVNKATFSAGLWKDNIQAFAAMRDNKCFDSGLPGVSQAATYSQFITGKALMLPALQTAIPLIQAANPSFKWSVFAPPTKKAGQQHGFISISPMVTVSAAGKKNPAALAFWNFAARPAQSAAYAKFQQFLSIDQVKNQEVLPWMEPLKKTLYGNGGPSLYENSQFKTFSTYTTLNQSLVGLFTGQSTVDSILAKLDSTYGH